MLVVALERRDGQGEASLALHVDRAESELAGRHPESRSRDLGEDAVDVDVAMGGAVGLEAARGLLELPLTTGLVVARRMVPGDGHVDEALEKVALGRRRLPPLVLELLVRLEVRTRPDQLQPSLETHGAIIGVPERC
jgi:hypothetical protein